MPQLLKMKNLKIEIFLMPFLSPGLGNTCEKFGFWSNQSVLPIAHKTFRHGPGNSFCPFFKQNILKFFVRLNFQKKASKSFFMRNLEEFLKISEVRKYSPSGAEKSNFLSSILQSTKKKKAEQNFLYK